MSQRNHQFDRYETASRRWPGVSLPRGAFAQRLAQLKVVRHAEDLFLAMAAGWRQGAAWEAIEHEHAWPVQLILRKGATAGERPEELWRETVAQLMSDDKAAPALPDGRQPARIVQYTGLAALRSYLTTVAKRRAIDQHRYRSVPGRQAVSLEAGSGQRGGEAGAGLREALGADAAVGREAEEAELLPRLARALDRAVAQLSLEQRFLIALVYGQGLSQRLAAKLAGVSEFKASRLLGGAYRQIQEVIESDANLSKLEWSSGLREAWADYWSDALAAMQGEAGGASKHAAGAQEALRI